MIASTACYVIHRSQRYSQFTHSCLLNRGWEDANIWQMIMEELLLGSEKGDFWKIAREKEV